MEMAAVGAEVGGVAASGGGGWCRWRLGCGGRFWWGWGGRGRGVGGGAPSDGVWVVGVEDVPAVDVTWMPALAWIVVEDVVFLHSGVRGWVRYSVTVPLNQSLYGGHQTCMRESRTWAWLAGRTGWGAGAEGGGGGGVGALWVGWGVGLRRGVVRASARMALRPGG